MALNLATAAVHAAGHAVAISETSKRRHNTESPVVAVPFSALFSQSARGALAEVSSQSAPLKAGGTRGVQDLQGKKGSAKSSGDVLAADQSSHRQTAPASKDSVDPASKTAAKPEQPLQSLVQPMREDPQSILKQPEAKSAAKQAASSRTMGEKTHLAPAGVEGAASLTGKKAPDVHPSVKGLDHASAVSSETKPGVQTSGNVTGPSALGVNPLVPPPEHAFTGLSQATPANVKARSASVDNNTTGKVSRAPASGVRLENMGTDQASESQAQRIMQNLDPDYAQSVQVSSQPSGVPADSASHDKTASAGAQASSNPLPEAGGKRGEVLSVSAHKAVKSSTPHGPANTADNGGMSVPAPESSVSATSPLATDGLLSSQNAPLLGQDSSNPNWVAPTQITANLVNAMSESLSVMISGAGEEIKIQINGAGPVISSLAEHAQEVAGSMTKNISGKAGEDRSGRHSQRQPRFPK